MKKIIVIGGGASGLVAAIYASKTGSNVTILEKNNSCGKKILVTGNGRCNYWNSDQSLNHYRSDNADILEDIINQKNQKEIVSFFEKIGIDAKIKDGYYYPLSNQAVSVQNALIVEAKSQNVDIKTNIDVLDIQKVNKKFVIKTEKENLECDVVILATGSKAAPKTGSDGKGYEIATKLGHTMIKPLPALVQLVANEKYFKEWNGIRAEAEVLLYENGEEIAKEYGEIQLTDYGVSGICVFQISGRVARGIENSKTEHIVINFLPWLKEEFEEWMNKREQKISNRTVSQLLDGVLNYKLVNVLLKKSEIDFSKAWKELSKKEKEILKQNITALKINITSTNSFEKAQVCTGGVPLLEIDPNTLESKKVRQLYIVGELLDCDGDCGGYNLSWAWITGMLAGKASSKGE